MEFCRINFGPIVVPFLYQWLTQSYKWQICTSIVCWWHQHINYKSIQKRILNLKNEWLNTNLLYINFNKTHYIQFMTKNKPKTHIKITYDNKQISATSNIKFLGIHINDKINWKYYIEYILSKLSDVCYAVGIIKPYMCLEVLKIVYYSNFNSIINYSIINYGLPFCSTSLPSKKKSSGCKRG